MSFFLDQQFMTLECPACRKTTQRTIGWVRTHSKFTCPAGHVIALKTDKLKKEMAALQVLLEKLKFE